jgi:PAS domain S-box-containing protein
MTFEAVREDQILFSLIGLTGITGGYMKRTSDDQGCHIREPFPGIFAKISFEIGKMAIFSILFLGMLLLWPPTLSQALASEKVQSANSSTPPSTSLQTIIVGDYYPYTFSNSEGAPDGFSVDIARAVAGVMERSLVITVDTWEHATRALSDGTIDLLPMMAYSPERDKTFDFSAPHTIAYDAVFSRSGAQKIKSLQELVNKTVIVMNKDIAHQYLLSSGLASKMKLILVDSLPDALRTLAEGKGDNALMPKLVGLIIIQKLNLTNLDPHPMVIDAYNRPFSFAVRDGNQALLERLSQGLSIIKSTGQYHEIYNKWFGTLEPPGLAWGTVIKYIAVIIAIFLLIALGLLLWTVSLRRQVSVRTKHLAVEIHERKRAEEALWEQLHFLQQLLDTIPTPIFYKDRQGIFRGCNGAYENFLGMSKEQIVGKTVFGLAPHDLANVYHEADEVLFAQPGTQVYETSFLHADGKRHNTIFNKATYVGKDGRVAGLVGVILDITERKLTEENMRRMSERLDMAQQAAMAGTWDWDILNSNIEWSEHLYHLFGLDPRQVVASFELWRQVLHPDDLKIAGERIDDALRERTALNSDYRVILPDGTIRWINAVGQGYYDQSGKPLRMIGVCTDITNRKRADEALKESEEKYRTIIEDIEDGYHEVDMHGNFTFFNEPVCKMLGYEREELLGMNNRQYAEEENANKVYQAYKQVYRTGKPIKNFEWQVIKKDGALRDVEVSISLIRDREGHPTGFRGIVRDITDRKRAEEETRSLQERLQRSEKMESLGTLAGGVAHDLNNVLGVVVGYAEMILDGVDKSSPLRHGLENIMSGGIKAAAIVEDLLTLARRGVQGRSILNLNKIIADCQKSPELLNLFVHHPFVQIKTDLETDLLNIAGSSVHLSKSLYNLISNASEAMPKGGTVTVKTTNQYLDKPIQGYDQIRGGDYVVLSVSDTGEGISATDLKRIFEPFYTKKIMGRSGTGLGLAVVWGTAKDHNGYINVQSEEGKGSIFTLYFPVTREEITAAVVAVAISEYMGKGESLLVVDDVKEQRDLATGMLKMLNYNVSSVSSGEDAVAYVKEHEVDLIVLDMIMDPGMDGLDTYRNVLDIRPKQKAIIVSGFSETERAKEAQKLGAGAYIKKPYIMEKIGVAIRDELGRHS